MPYRGKNVFKRERLSQDSSTGRKSEHPYLSAKRKYFQSELDEVDKEIVEVIKNVGAERFGKLFNHNEEATHLFRPKKRSSEDVAAMYDNDDSGSGFPPVEAGVTHSIGITNPCDAIFRTFMANRAAREDRQRSIAQEAHERVCALENATRHQGRRIREERERASASNADDVHVGGGRTQPDTLLQTPHRARGGARRNDDAHTRREEMSGGETRTSDTPEAAELDAKRLAAEILRDAEDAEAVACVPVATLSQGGKLRPIIVAPAVVDGASAALRCRNAIARGDAAVAQICDVDGIASTCPLTEKVPLTTLDIVRDDRCYVETGRDNFHLEVAALKGTDDEVVPRNPYWQTALGNGAASSSSSNAVGLGVVGNAGGPNGNHVDNRPPHLFQQQQGQGQTQEQQDGQMHIRAGCFSENPGQPIMPHGQQSQQQTHISDEWNRNQQMQQQQMQIQQYQQMQQQPPQLWRQPQQVKGANEWNQNQHQRMQQQLMQDPQFRAQETRPGNQNQNQDMHQQLQQMQGEYGWDPNQYQQMQQPQQQVREQPCQQPHEPNDWNQNPNRFFQQHELQLQRQQVPFPSGRDQHQQFQQQGIRGANVFHQDTCQQMQHPLQHMQGENRWNHNEYDHIQQPLQQMQGENGYNHNQFQLMQQQQISGTNAYEPHQSQYVNAQPEQIRAAHGWTQNQNHYQPMQHQVQEQISNTNEWSHHQQQAEHVQAGSALHQNFRPQQSPQENSNPILPETVEQPQATNRSSPTTIFTSRAADTNYADNRQMPLWAHGLDPSQLSAAGASFDQCQIVSAGPGAGKTHYLVARTLRYKMEHPKHGVACVTFSREIAGEVDDRIRTALKQLKLPTDNLFCGTIHKLALRIVRTFSQELGFGDRIRMANKKELESTLKSALAHSNNVNREQNWGDMAEDVSDDEMDDEHARKILNRLRRMQKFPDFRAQQDAEIQKIYMTFKEMMQEKCLIDVNDLVPLATRAFQFPIAQQWASEFLSYLLVDEFQDTDCAQIELFRRITDRCITVVGDEDQMIYGWRMSKEGFDSTNPFDIFEKLFFNSQVHCLERNYRSPPEIVQVSNKLMHLAPNRRSDKTSMSMLPSAPGSVRCVVKHTVDKEIEWIIEQMRTANMPWSTFAILARLNKIKDYIERKLRDQGIPTKGPKIKKWEPECVCFLGYLKLAVDVQDDKAFLEVYNSPKRGLGKKFIEQLDTLPGGCYYQKAKNLVHNTRSRMATNALSFIHIIDSLKTGLASDALKTVGKLINMEVPHVLASLAGILDVPQFLAETKEPRSICVSVCTIHGAKGLEWNTVFVARVNEGVLPMLNEDGKNEDEERRLLYVAMTRARHKLYLSCSLTDERDQHAEPSRFLCESGVA